MLLELINKNREKLKYLSASIIILTVVLLVSVAYKSNEKIVKKSEIYENTNQSNDLKTFKEFFFKQIKSPFTNLNYEIQKGDSIQKILKKLQVQDREINNVINQYKKYGNPSKLLTGDKIDIIVRENLSNKKKSIVKFSAPITKSTSISITRSEEGNLVSKKIITKLYKKKILSENTNDRIQMFEEAAGISHYKKQRNATLIKIQETQNNMNRVHDIIIEVGQNVDNLDTQMKPNFSGSISDSIYKEAYLRFAFIIQPSCVIIPGSFCPSLDSA